MNSVVIIVVPLAIHSGKDGKGSQLQQESSAKMTNQRVSDAFTSSPFSIHVRHILPTSKFQHSYFYFFLYQ